jgi:hypothetical protein
MISILRICTSYFCAQWIRAQAVPSIESISVRPSSGVPQRVLNMNHLLLSIIGVRQGVTIKFYLGPPYPNPSTPCRQATPERAFLVVSKVACPQSGRFTTVFYPFGHPMPCASAFRVTRTHHNFKVFLLGKKCSCIHSWFRVSSFPAGGHPHADCQVGMSTHRGSIGTFRVRH